MRFLKKLLIVCFAAVSLFTAAVLVLCGIGATVPDALIYSFFGAFGAEAVLSALIKMQEKKDGVRDDTNEVHDAEPDLHAPGENPAGICDRAQRGNGGEANERQAVG